MFQYGVRGKESLHENVLLHTAFLVAIVPRVVEVLCAILCMGPLLCWYPLCVIADLEVGDLSIDIIITEEA